MGFGTKNFYGKIDGKCVNDAYSCMDTTTSNVDDRKANVAKAFYINGKEGRMYPLWERLFDQPDTGVGHIKLVLTCDDAPYSATNVARVFDSVGTYLLHKQMNDKKCEYTIFNNDKMFREALKNDSLDRIMEKAESVSGDDGEMKMMLLVDGKNFKKEIKQQIFASDYDDPEIGEGLRCYKKYADGLTEQINNIRELNKLSNEDIEELDYIYEYGFGYDSNYFDDATIEDVYVKYKMGDKDIKPSEFIAKEKSRARKLNQQRADIHDDMIQLKDGVKKTIYFKYSGETPTPPEFDTENLDFWDKNIVRLVAKLDPSKCTHEVTRAWYDAFRKAYDKLIEDTLSPNDEELFEVWRGNESFEDYCNVVDLNLKTAYHRVTSIITLIQRQMVEDYELDYYYTEMVKGDWKTCSKCGEVKIKNEYYFNKDAKGRDGYKSMCKKCQSK